MTFELIWQYILIFVMAATPWLEILIVIPLGIAIGLHPIPVAIVSFVGNFLPILLIVYLMKWFQSTQWYKRRLEKKRLKKLAKEEQQEEGTVIKKKNKKERAAAIFEKYGLPGLAFLGPIITGIHLAAIIALSLKANKNKTTFWMAISLFIWTVAITVMSFYSIDWLIN
ncbi:small multi-drug export protein [Evansella cellulosilytica]|uniref:Small multi-drug export protein n=1 Tax=Evansella cellulosilytica (strain ATCC 21833 / DSM 2522 / FERM P-1141 / JCM 9156 / N-4) TaxID=649639 RepID=E6U059_EVAC2|nr:small multi-drug export protein [Evansella cellulosilytica]ADU29063.1 hypothetical protein Bcell_0782 [Evansella cellulosilytica DSM 2522]